jgi:hypothetical protein
LLTLIKWPNLQKRGSKFMQKSFNELTQGLNTKDCIHNTSFYL